MNTYAIILAAGKGTRMQSNIPKVLHRVGGIPMIEHLVSKLESMNVDEIFVVIGYKGDMVKAYLGSRVTYVEQPKQLGTAHAVSQVSPLLKDKQGATLVLVGDTPLIKQWTMERLIQVQRAKQCAGVVLTALIDNPGGYGRILRDKLTGEVLGIVEDKDATIHQRLIREINTGIFCFDNGSLFQALPNIKDDNAQREFYLTDIIPYMRLAGTIAGQPGFEAVTLPDASEVAGINNREQLAAVESFLQVRTQAVL
ncbi:NTP transferase domain-containing protein [Paenibacillus thermotolerans]|uniref:NTP transferase domain-containing protein n=1 Tax=Paenibacillus thermotolerans TaxID=3027807 RepID=UPI00236827B3|nr:MULTISPECIES: NTP transferase domain-containing protein [unclassified Paenibacillus]